MEQFHWLIIAAGCVAALNNWRLGVAVMIVAGLIQDPIRKVTPGAPVHLTVMFVPIYVCILARIIQERRASSVFLRYFPRLRGPLLLACIALVASSLVTLSYGIWTVPAAAIGLFSYVGALPGVLFGFYYIGRHFDELNKVLLVYIAVVAVMLSGVVLEHVGYSLPVPALGPMRRELWLRWVDGYTVRMLCGFFRSPEIMGWHAATMTMICLYFAIRKPNLLFLWLPLSALGAYGVLMSGRRKMLLAILAYLITLIWMTRGPVRKQLAILLGGGGLCVIPALFWLVPVEQLAAAKSGLLDAGVTASMKGWAGPIWLLGQVGPFGFGVGTKSQGTQHLAFGVRTPMCEGGFEKVLIELGIFGFASILLLMGGGVRYVVSCVRDAWRMREQNIAPVALGCFLCANLAMFLISFQVFGDPFIVVLLGIVVGAVLSIRRLAFERSVCHAGR